MTDTPIQLTDAELDYVSGGGAPSLVGHGILTAAEAGGHAPLPADMPTTGSGVIPGQGIGTAPGQQ